MPLKKERKKKDVSTHLGLDFPIPSQHCGTGRPFEFFQATIEEGANTWKRIVSRASGAVHVLLTAPAKPPAARCAAVPMWRCSWRRATAATPTRASVCIARARVCCAWRITAASTRGEIRKQQGWARPPPHVFFLPPRSFFMGFVSWL
jgi:hypothetical protein